MSLFSKGEKIMSFFPDRHEEHRHQDPQQRPFLSPAGFHGVGFLHTPERSCGKVQETSTTSWPPNIWRHLFLTKLLRNE